MAEIHRVELLRRLGSDAQIRTTQSSRDVASFSLAKDTGWYDKDNGEWSKNLHWHKIVTLQPRLIGALCDKGKKGVRVIVDGELSYRTWRKDGEATDRAEAEIIQGLGRGISRTFRCTRACCRPFSRALGTLRASVA